MTPELLASGGASRRGVIWITGYSSAGKTTLGRIVSLKLAESGSPSLFLDGDDLRGILGHSWGYTDDERRELAKVYFRLCSYIASQQPNTLVISAAAMYAEVYQWLRDNVPGGMIVYLDVPEDVRHRRDAGTKGVYADIAKHRASYDVPESPDLVVPNPYGADLHASGERVVERYLSIPYQQADRGKSTYWDSYYRQHTGVLEPSPFAEVSRDVLRTKGATTLIEVGCGNGRDAVFFANSGFEVTALDTSPAAIDFCRSSHGRVAEFRVGALSTHAAARASSDAVYSRFVLHAMTLDEEIDFLKAATAVVRPGGNLLIECRSIQDPLARKGKIVSPTERIHGHYRRFIVLDEIIQRVTAAGFEIESAIEDNGLAVFGDEDPTVIRLIATKPPDLG